MSEKIFIFPADSDTNESIAKHALMAQVEPDWTAKCFIGRNQLELPVYPVPNLLFKSLKYDKRMAFYAFKQIGEKKQFFYSQGVNPKSVLSQSALSQKVAELIEKSKAEKEKV